MMAEAVEVVVVAEAAMEAEADVERVAEVAEVAEAVAAMAVDVFSHRHPIPALAVALPVRSFRRFQYCALACL